MTKDQVYVFQIETVYKYLWRSVSKLVKALVLADVVGAHVAVKVIPEVIPEHREEGVVLLDHGHAVLAAEVVGLTISPIEPGDGLILVRPHPVSRLVLTVPLLLTRNDKKEIFEHFPIFLFYLSGSSEPELAPFSDLKFIQQNRLEPVVDSRMIQLRDPGPVMEVTQDVRVLLGDLLPARDEETSASGAVLLQSPAIRTVVSVLGQGVGEQQREGDQGEPHHVSGQ